MREPAREASSAARSPRRVASAALGVFGLALVLRAAFVAWAPISPSGDARWYHFYAAQIAAGRGYADLDGSPVVQWMPGWPLMLAGLYRVLGTAPLAGAALNAVLGAAGAALLVPLGTRLLGLRAGLLAGLLCAAWPGLVYFSATLMTETAFVFWLVAALALLARGAAPETERRAAWCAASGAALGGAALVRSEPLALLPVMALYLWTALRERRAFARGLAALVAAAAVMVAPWAARNYAHFGRVLATSASGGHNAWLGNHPGATGGEMIGDAVRYTGRYRRATRAETSLAVNDAGWADARAFALAQPREALRLALRKLALTYAGDSGGERMLRGVSRKVRVLDARTHRRLVRVADAFWFAALALAGVGLLTLRAWPLPTRVLLLGWPATWIAIHMVFIGGARFHVPEIPALALLAACGALALARGAVALRRRVAPA